MKVYVVEIDDDWRTVIGIYDNHEQALKRAYESFEYNTLDKIKDKVEDLSDFQKGPVQVLDLWESGTISMYITEWEVNYPKTEDA